MVLVEGSRVGVVAAVVEVKCSTSKLQFKELRNATLLNKNLGVVFKDHEFGETIQLRRGHAWRSQLLVQTIVLRVSRAILVLVLDDAHVVVETEFSMEEQTSLVLNSTARFALVCLELEKQRTNTPTQNGGTARGRPKKISKLQRLQNLCRRQPFANLLCYADADEIADERHNILGKEQSTHTESASSG